VFGSFSDSIIPRKHLDAIFESLPEEYGQVISSFESNFDPLPIIEVEVYYLRTIHKCRRRLIESLSINIAQGGSEYSRMYSINLNSFNSQN